MSTFRAGDRAAARKAALPDPGKQGWKSFPMARTSVQAKKKILADIGIRHRTGGADDPDLGRHKIYEDSSPEEFAALAGRIREAGKLAACRRDSAGNGVPSRYRYPNKRRSRSPYKGYKFAGSRLLLAAESRHFPQ